ncbi:hypothetical protein [Brachybacterium sp. EE-P12]|uniref:hypothetical protein n=1 Tax=Brachybacterium sp. EE-P12 TaxID=2306299 RepID=UPI000F084F5F|nr:hypothetical protein [Brachybacterium sp. EE-P12]
MKNATIATSRTRADSDHLIPYRPRPATWGDVETLQAVRAQRSRAAGQGLDPSTLEARAGRRADRTHEAGRGPASQRTVPAGRHRARPSFPALLAPLLGVPRSA